MKKLAPAAAALLLALLGTACGSPAAPAPSPESTPILYSNLTDPTSQEEVAAALQSHGISQERTDTLLAWADDFNTRVTKPALPEGFVPMEGTYVDYSSLLFDYKELPDGSFFPEANCRLSAFLLMQDLICTGGTADETDTYLMFDLDAIDSQDVYHLSPEARERFITLYNSIPVDNDASQEEHVAAVTQAWKDRDIQVEGSGISLVEIYLHSPFDSLRFVGHVGILLETDDGLLFVEKFGPEEPFQATKFQDRGQLSAYLLARPDLYGDKTELPPILLENGAPLTRSP